MPTCPLRKSATCSTKNIPCLRLQSSTWLETTPQSPSTTELPPHTVIGLVMIKVAVVPAGLLPLSVLSHTPVAYKRLTPSTSDILNNMPLPATRAILVATVVTLLDHSTSSRRLVSLHTPAINIPLAPMVSLVSAQPPATISPHSQPSPRSPTTHKSALVSKTS